MSLLPTGIGAVMAAAAIVVLAGVGRADPASRALEDYRLANGLRVILVPDPLLGDPTVAVVYAGGSAADPPHRRGLAHLVEHLSFRGSRHLAPLEADEVLAKVGAEYSAFTAPEETVYLTRLPSRALATSLWIESERMGFALDGIDETALELERRIVVNELAERGGGLSRVLWQWRQRLLYGELHPLAPDRGEADHVRAVALPEVQWFFQSSHRPDNATLVIAGDFEAHAARQLVERYFAPIRSAPLPRLVRAVSPPVLCHPREVELGHPYRDTKRLQLVWPLPGNLTPAQRVNLEATRSILQRRLEHRLTWSAAKAVRVDVAVVSYRDHGLFIIDAQPRDEHGWEVVEAPILREVANITTRPIEAQELRALRALLLSRTVFSRARGVERSLALAAGRDLDAEQAAIELLDAAAVLAAAGPLRRAHFTLRARPSPRAADDLVVLRDDGACP